MNLNKTKKKTRGKLSRKVSKFTSRKFFDGRLEFKQAINIKAVVERKVGWRQIQLELLMSFSPVSYVQD